MRKLILLTLFSMLTTAAVAKNNLVVRADLDGPVDVIHTEYLLRAMDVAEKKGAALFLLVMDTPGGLAQSMERIIKRILGASMPVAVFVYPPGARGASAGFFILISADIAAMAPGTRTGAAHPIMSFGGMPIGGGQKKKTADDKKNTGETGDSTAILMEKVTQDILASLRAVAQRRGRNIDMCVQAVKDSKSFSDDEALKGHVIDLRAKSVDDLLKQINGMEITRIDGTKAALTLDRPTVEKVPMTRAGLDRMEEELKRLKLRYTWVQALISRCERNILKTMRCMPSG